MSDSVIMFIGQIFNGLKIGSVYSLVALGYTCLLYTSDAADEL